MDLNNYRGGATSSSILVTSDGVSLPHQDCAAVQLSNWNVTDTTSYDYADTAAKNNQKSGDPSAVTQQFTQGEIYFGFGGVAAHQLFPGETSDLLPIDNLSRLTLRCRPGETRRLYYTWYW